MGAQVDLRLPDRLPQEGAMLIWLVRRLGGLLLVVLLVAFALLASMAIEEREPPRPYEPPPPCRVVPSPAGAWGDARCLHAPARQQAGRADAADR
jgi:hypothetical protein